MGEIFALIKHVGTRSFLFSHSFQSADRSVSKKKRKTRVMFFPETLTYLLKIMHRLLLPTRRQPLSHTAGATHRPKAGGSGRAGRCAVRRGPGVKLLFVCSLNHLQGHQDPCVLQDQAKGNQTCFWLSSRLKKLFRFEAKRLQNTENQPSFSLPPGTALTPDDSSRTIMK